jgi:HrpA-like RNA helicase
VFLEKDLDNTKNEYIKEGLNIIKKLLKKSDDKGGILLFVASVNETNEVCDALNIEGGFKESNLCISVYSGMNDDEQKKATDKDYFREFVGPNGRKIIVATNVAESSLTIEGISYVIDSGLELRNRFDPQDRIDILEKGFITSAQARQRMGRTGRTGPGTCYHLYTEDVFKNKMEKFPLPAIKIESISYEMIRLLAIDGIDDIGTLVATLNKFIEPPNKKYIDAELKYLYNINMITSTENNGKLTQLGEIVSDLQLEPRIVLMMITGFRLNCFREVLGIISVMDAIKGSLEQLFVLPTDILDEAVPDKKKVQWLTKKFELAKDHFSNKYGDHIAILKIFGEYEKNKDDGDKLKNWTYKYFLKRDILDKAYGIYTKLKYRYRNKLNTLSLAKPSQDVLNMDLKYKVMASLMTNCYGSSDCKFNRLLVVKNKIETADGQLKNIQLDKMNFVGEPIETKTFLFYHKLHQFNNSPIKAKIVSKVSKKAEEILGKLFELPLTEEKQELIEINET